LRGNIRKNGAKTEKINPINMYPLHPSGTRAEATLLRRNGNQKKLRADSRILPFKKILKTAPPPENYLTNTH
jgi:hypothetical protein